MRKVHSAAGLLRLIRDGVANDWDGLQEFWERLGSHTSGSNGRFENEELHQLLRELRLLGLIACKGDFRRGGRIEITKLYKQIQTTLGISLGSLMKVEDGAGMIVTPYFRPPRGKEEMPNVLVAMSFNPKLNPVYVHISKVVRSLKLTVQRGDDLSAPNAIMDDIWRRICGARVVIADCTGRSPNVFYEIGLAHAIGTPPVILITQRKANPPFDLRHNRYIEYKYPSKTISGFKRRLAKAIAETLKLGHAGRKIAPQRRARQF